MFKQEFIFVFPIFCHKEYEYTAQRHHSVIQAIGTPCIEEVGIEACIRIGRQGYNYMPQVRTSKMPPC